ncbi:MAG TPA: MarR family transcriptional regulator [Caldimonas sp.]|jgi:DNA-binding MarR family transcriptional regulator|nr:MarR family transcriptional regulator [Caldimonas sp.]
MNRFDPHLGLLLERAGRVVGERLDRAFGRDGVTADHWRVLRLLADGEGHTMGEIAERLQMNPPTLTKLVDRMVGKSLVQRAADPEDSRRVLVYATDAGFGLLNELQGKVDQHHAALQALLGDRNARQLERLLTTLIEAAQRPTA